MTTTIQNQTSDKLVPSRAGAIGALIAAATFIFGIALFVTSLSDYAEGDFTAAESVDFLVGHQGILGTWLSSSCSGLRSSRWHAASVSVSST